MILFRADSNKQIASGHIMRCLSIAKAFCEAGESVKFFVADDNPVQMLERAGVEYTVLNTRWNNLDEEIEIMQDKLRCYVNPLLIIDTYSVTRKYAEALMPYAKVCYLGSKLEYLGALYALINYSADIDDIFYLSNYRQNSKLLLGPSYAPLRKEFIEVTHQDSSNGRFGILLTTGNTDPHNYVGKILDSLKRLNYINQMDIHVVVGSMFEKKAELYEKYDNHTSIILHENVQSMSSLMAFCDFAITANGTTVYELAAARVPAITFAMVDEQVKSAQKLNELGVVDYCGEMYNDEYCCIERITERAILYINKPTERQKHAEKAYSVIDGRGCERIVAELKNI